MFISIDGIHNIDDIIKDNDYFEPYKDLFMDQESFTINDINISIADDKWDLSSLAPEGKCPESYRFCFNRIKRNEYKQLLKAYDMFRFFSSGPLQTVNLIYHNIIIKFINFLSENYYSNLTDIGYLDYLDFEEYQGTEAYSPETQNRYKYAVHSFLNFWAGLNNTNMDKDLEDYLLERNTDAVKAHNLNNRTKLLPFAFMNKFKDFLYNQIMTMQTDNKQDLYEYVQLYILTQCGLRPMESIILPRDCIEIDYIDENKAICYLNYKSTKKNSDKYVYCKTRGSAKLKSVIDRVLEVSNDEEYLFDIRNRTSKHLWLKLKLICIQHCKDLGLLKSSESSSFHVTKTATEFMNYGSTNHKSAVSKLLKKHPEIPRDKYISIPKLYQFRVYFATELHDQGVPDPIIAKMMNQSDEKMWGYYVRIHDIEIQEQEKEVTIKISADILADEYKIHGPKAKERTRQIKRALKRPVKTASDYIEAAKLAVEDVPIRMMEGGCCIKSSKGMECTYDDVTDISKCAYGRCPNQHHFIFNIPYYYEKCENLLTIIDYNLNLELPRTNFAEHELKKLQNIIKAKLTPEMKELKEKIYNNKVDILLDKFPDLEYFVENYDKVIGEMNKWVSMTI